MSRYNKKKGLLQLNPEKLLHGIYPLYRLEIKGREATVIMPEITEKLNGLKWVVYHTGAGEDCNSITGEGAIEKPPIIKLLLEDGFLVCTITSGTQHWGSPSAEEAHDDLYAYMVREFPVEKKVNILAQSMGGTSAYPWASSNPEKVERIYGIYPITNYKSMGGRNPIDNLKVLAEHNIRIMHRHGTEDKSVPFEENAKLFEEAYKNIGGSIKITSVPGVGHQYHPLIFVARDVLDFFNGRI